MPLNGFDHLAFLVLEGARWRFEEGPRASGHFTTIPSFASGRDGTWFVASTLESGGTRKPQVWWRAPGLGWESTTVTQARDAVMPWLQPAQAGVAVTYYASDGGRPAGALPPPVGQPAEPPAWSVRARVLPDGEEVRVAERIHLGGICTSGDGCSEADWMLRDYFQTAVTKDGTLAIAYPRAVRGGVEVVAVVGVPA